MIAWYEHHSNWGGDLSVGTALISTLLMMFWFLCFVFLLTKPKLLRVSCEQFEVMMYSGPSGSKRSELKVINDLKKKQTGSYLADFRVFYITGNIYESHAKLRIGCPRIIHTKISALALLIFTWAIKKDNNIDDLFFSLSHDQIKYLPKFGFWLSQLLQQN